MVRRTVLRGLAGTAIGLPLLSLGGGRGVARASWGRERGFPQRLVIFYTPNGPLKFTDRAGVVHDHFFPEVPGRDAGFTLTKALTPLEPWKKRLNLVKLDLRTAKESVFADPHVPGMCSLLTGSARQQLRFDEGIAPSDFDRRPASQGDGVSLDQRVASLIGRTTPLRSLELGVLTEVGRRAAGIRRISFSALGAANPSENDPRKVFDTLFRDAGADLAQLERIRAERLSVLDTVNQQFADLRVSLGGDDRRRIERHLDLVRDVELRVRIPASAARACLPPPLPPSLASDENSVAHVLPLQLDLAATALACDLTRVVTIQVVNSQNEIHYPFVSKDGPERHAMGHNPTGVHESVFHWQKILAYETWHFEQLARFLRTLEATREGEGSLLDNTVVLACTEMGNGVNHDYRDVPFLIFGNAGGRWKTGRFLQLPQVRPHNDILLTLLQGFGSTDTCFGAPAYCTGPLDLG